MAVSVTDMRHSNRLRGRRYPNAGGARLWTGFVACFFMVRKNGKVQKEFRTFGTTTRELLGVREWLLSEGCTHIAMESTRAYWEPVYAVLEGGELEIVVANAQRVKRFPGRKTDVKDAEWISDLLCHGLLRSSFIPPYPIRQWARRGYKRNTHQVTRTLVHRPERLDYAVTLRLRKEVA